MSSQKKPRAKMQIGPLTAPKEPSQQTPPSLIGGFTSTQFQSQQRELNIEVIHPRKDQPRRTFTAESIEQLTQSVRTHGILQPLSVHLKDGQYDLIAGERRLRAAKAAGLTEVPVRVFEHMSDIQIRQLAALENLQREDLNPVDETDAIMDILSSELRIPRRQLTAQLERWKALKMRNPELINIDPEENQGIERLEQVFQALSRGAWTSFVANRLPVLRLPEMLLEAVRTGKLEYTKAIAIKSAPPIFHAKLVAQAQTMGISSLRQAIKEASLTPTDQEDFQKYNAQFLLMRRKLTPSKILELEQNERDYVMELLHEVEAVLDGEAEVRRKVLHFTQQGEKAGVRSKSKKGVLPDE